MSGIERYDYHGFPDETGVFVRYEDHVAVVEAARSTREVMTHHLPECPTLDALPHIDEGWDEGPCICDRLRSLEARILSKLDTTGACWLWTGVIDRYGYGQIKRSGKNYKAHRVVYEALVGPIPDGMELDHLCKVRNCVRPDHCEPVDHRTNTLRGQTVTAINAAKTHCDEGHPFDEDNTYERKRGGRVCRKCHAERERERYHARKEAR